MTAQTTTVPSSLAGSFWNQLQTVAGMVAPDDLGNNQALFELQVASDGTLTVLRPDTVDPAAVTAAAQATLNAATAQQTATTNAATLRQKAQQALTVNSNFLALASPTNAQTLAQVQALTRECSALIRLVIQQLDTTAGT